jgi:anti-sigma factor RsiW
MSGDSTCDRFSDNLAELALGTLAGRERIATLGHVESCALCANELEHLSRASDAILHMAPDMEPPLGFEVRVCGRMENVAAQAPRHALQRWLLAGAAALVALALGVGIGLSAGSSPSKAKVATASKPWQTAKLVADGSTVGGVSLYGGSTPVLTMELAESMVKGTVTCEIVTNGGVTHKIGTFKVTHGYGAWVAPLGVPPNDVRVAELISSRGTTVATATLR